MLSEQDIKPISFLKTNTADLISQVNHTLRPVYVTQNERAKAVIVDAKSYEKTINALNLLKLVFQGEKDYQNKRYSEQSKFFKEFEKKHILFQNQKTSI